MKKIFPTILLPTLFVTLIITQIFVNGRESGASYTKNETQKNSFLEYEFQRISGDLLNGEAFDKSVLKQKYVVVSFWASWCIPCIPKLDILQNVADKIGVVSVNMDDSSTLIKARKIVNEKKLSFPIIEDKENFLGNKFLVKTLPYALLFKKGKLVKVFGESEKFTQKILKEYLD
jgi:thiol-disulfide isomerase/thioredoxin